MDKILKELLRIKFLQTNVDIDSLMEIVHMTPNAELAVEKLCNLYVPVSDMTGEKRYSNNKTKTIYEFVSYDEWTNTVTYKYTYEKHIGIYIHKDTPVEDVNKDNYKSYERKYNSQDNLKYVSIPVGTYDTSTESMSRQQWLDKELVPRDPNEYAMCVADDDYTDPNNL